MSGHESMRHEVSARTNELMKLEPSVVMGLYRAGRIDRRDLMRLFGAMGMAAVGSRYLARSAAAAEDLTMIIWEGYSDPTYAEPFEQANDATISATFASTGDEMFASMQGSGGESYDLVSASSDLPQRLYDAGLLAEIDTSKLTNYGKLYEQFQKPPYITFDDKLYGVNFAWGPTIMIYDTEAVTDPPTSWTALLDEQYKGKISTWNYPIQIAQYALLLDPKPDDPYELSDEQLAQVKDILIQQKPLIRKYWDLGGEVAELFLTKEIVIADGWSWITLQALAEEAPVAEVVPTEGVTGWSDSWCISKNAKNYDLALKWADWMIGDEGQLGITEVMNYSITNKDVAEALPADRKTALRMDDVATEYAKIHMWRFIPGYDKWVQVWNEATQG